MAHGVNTKFSWEGGTPKWDSDRKKVWLKWKWQDDYFTGRLTKVLDHFEIQVRYTFKNANGGIETQQKSPESMSDFRDGDFIFDYYWEVPAECLTVEFAIHAIAKTESRNGGSVPYFEDDPWPSPAFYCGDATVPDKPSAPSVSHNAQIGTQVVLGLDNVRDGDNNKNVVQVEFQTVYYNTDPESELGEGIKVQRTEKAKVDEFGNARALVYIGNKYGYKFRARLCGVRDKDAGGTIERQIEVFSEWSELTDIVLGVPERPSITMRKYTDVTAEYQIKAKNPYDHYQIQSAQTLDSFDLFDDWEREYPQFKENSDERTAALQNCGVYERPPVASQNGWINVTPLEAGKAYWRVRSVTAQSDGFYSTWSEPFELTFGETLRAPIVSMGSKFATLDDASIQLIIKHNSPNGSPTCRCDIYYGINTGGSFLPNVITIRPEDMNVGQNNDGSYTYYYNFNLQEIRDHGQIIHLTGESTITWRAYTFEGNRAAESYETRSPESEYVTFWVYERPSVQLTITDENGQSMPLDDDGHYILPGFPIRLVTSSNLGEKKVVSWNIRIIPTISYYNTGRHGEREVVNAGSVLYNQVDVKTPDDLDKVILANEVSLDQGVVYILEVTAAINTGVTVSTTAEFKMVFTGANVSIECASSYNFDNISLGLCPSAVKYEEKVMPLDIPRWENDNTPFEVSDKFVSDGTDYWVYNNILYGGTSLEYNPETSTLNQFHWNRTINNKYLLSNEFWTSEDGTAYGMAGDYPAILNTESDEWILDSRITPYGTSEPQMRFKYFNADTESYEDRLLTITNGTVTMHKFENGDWTDVSSLTPHSDATNGIGSNVWNFVMISPDGEYLAASILSDGSHDYVIQDGAIADVTSAFTNHLAGYNVWNLEGRMFWSGGSTHYELDTSGYPYEWKTVTWNGLTTFWGSYVRIVNGIAYAVRNNYLYRLDIENMEWIQIRCYSEDAYSYYGFRGSDVWTDGTDIRYDLSHVFNSTDHSWDIDKLTGLSGSFYGYDVWTDGTNIYHSYASKHYILDKSTKTWSSVTFTGQTSFDGVDIFHVDNKICLAHDNTDSKTHYYELDTTNLSWTQKTWNGNAPDPNGISGRHIWQHAGLIMSASNSAFRRYTLDPETMQWSRYGSMSDPYMTAENIWTDGINTYITGYGVGTHGRYSTFVLNEETLEWEYVHLEGWPDDDDYHSGNDVWHDLEGNTYYMYHDYDIKKLVNTEVINERTLVDNVELAVYRKNDDGTFVTIAENLINTEAAFVTDPHPNLGGSEYRIVATDMTTGQMIFYDPPPYDMQCTDIIIQWDEEYADIPFNDDSRETIRQFGSFVRLPYNIDVSESANIENSMVNYIGRKNPVSYYGTQTGYTASWSTEIPKYDTETIKMLRRLQVYPGDVYVREPSGTGYWAHVSVTFPINHCALTVSVSLSITRVEGGM